MRSQLTSQQRHTLWAYIFLAPALIFFAIFVVFPLLRALQYSLYDWPLGAPTKTFIGLANYQRLLFNDPIFLKSVWNTLRFTVGTLIPTQILALMLAMLLNQQRLMGKGFFRTVYFIPVVSSLVAVGFVWRWLLEPSFGMVNFLLRSIGLPGPGWLASPMWALPGVMFMTIWRDVGFYMVIFLAGLQTIPRVYYEAAAIDGADNWSQFRHVTLPLLNPTIVLTTVIGIINGLQVFTSVYVMTGGGTTMPGGPLNSTRTIVLHIVEAAFRSRNMGYASAAAFILFLMILVFALVQIRLTERNVDQ